MADYKSCDRCGDKVLSGDIRYGEQTGEELCEYCYDSYREDHEDSD